MPCLHDLNSFSLSVQGKWVGASKWNTVVDPLNGDPFIKVGEVDERGIQVHCCDKIFVKLIFYYEICSFVAHGVSCCLVRVHDIFKALFSISSPFKL